MLETVRSGKWFRGNGPNVAHFEEAYAKATGAKNCIATNSGTSALFTSLTASGIGRRRGHRRPLHLHRHGKCRSCCITRLPMFVDTDPETFQIDASKIEAAITDRTTAIMPVHLGGSRRGPRHDPRGGEASISCR